MKHLLLIFVLIVGFHTLYADDFVIDEPSSSSGKNSAPRPSLNSAPITPAVSQGGKYNTTIGSVPTGDSVGKGQFDISFAMYDSGGANTRFIVGIFDALDIGIAENFDGLIGSGKINVNIPGAYIKLTILKDYNNFNWAVGFDSFAYGRNGTYFDTNNNPSTMYGFYTAAGWHYSAFGGNDSVTFGLRIPMLPGEVRDITNTSLFGGISAGISSYFQLGLTLENIYFNGRGDAILPSFIVTFLPSPQFKLSLVLQYEFYSGRINRVFTLGYQAGF